MAVRVADSLKQQNDLNTFPVAFGEDIWLDKNKGSGTADYDSIQELYNNGQLGGSDIEVTTMPTASEDYLDTVLLYIGETGTYKYGTFYKCVSDGETPPTYSWVDAEIGGGDSKVFRGTEEEWEEFTTEEKKEYDAVATPDEGAEGTKDVYSTTEIKTNKVWIDGKPVYRKGYDVTLSTYTDSGDRRTFSHTLADTTTFPISFGGYVTILTNTTYPQTVGQTFCFGVSALVTGTGLDIGFSMGASSNDSIGTQVWTQLNKIATYGQATSIKMVGFLEYVKTA